MSFPAGVPLRQCSLGPDFGLVSGADYGCDVVITSSRPFMTWAATGSGAIGDSVTETFDPGTEVTFPLPVTDQDGWVIGGLPVDVSNGKQSHVYTLTIKPWSYSGLGGTKKYATDSIVKITNLQVPTGDGVLDLDKAVATAGSQGSTVTVPDLVGQLADTVATPAAEAVAARDVAQAAAAQAQDISGIATTDDAVSALVGDPVIGPKTTTALDVRNVGLVDTDGTDLAGAVNGRVARYNIREFGAKGDNAADDTAAVLSAINKLNTVGDLGQRRVLDLNGGTYLVTQPVILSGNRVGISNGTLKASSSWTAGPARSVLEFPNSAGDATAFNITVDGNHVAGAVNVQGWRTRLFYVEAVRFTPEGMGIVLKGEAQALGCSAFQWNDLLDGATAASSQANRTADAWVVDHADVKLVQCTGAWSGRNLVLTANARTGFYIGCHFYNGPVHDGDSAPHTNTINLYYDAGAYENTFIGTYWDNGTIDLYSTQVTILDSYFLKSDTKVTNAALCRLFTTGTNTFIHDTFTWRNNHVGSWITGPTFQLTGTGTWNANVALRFATVVDEADILPNDLVTISGRRGVITLTDADGTGPVIHSQESGMVINHAATTNTRVMLHNQARVGTTVQVVTTTATNLTIGLFSGATLNGATTWPTIAKYVLKTVTCVANSDGNSAAWVMSA